jgi:glycine hydroxymethyltransferase
LGFILTANTLNKKAKERVLLVSSITEAYAAAARFAACLVCFDKRTHSGILATLVSQTPSRHRPLKNVLFVCTGNVCRSPMAEALFRELVKDRGDYEVVSAGVGALPGQAASAHTANILREKGLDLSSFRSRPLTLDLMEKATHIFAMAGHHLEAIEMDFPQAADKAYLVSEFCSDDALRNQDVPDPIGMGREAYEETRRMLEAMLPSVLNYIEQTFPKKDP